MRHSRYLPLLARGGYAARGVVYLIVGVFAALAALGSGEAQGSQGALASLLSQPFGAVLVALMVAGLLSFAGWRIAQSLFDADGHGTDGKAIVVRMGLFGSAATHLALAAFAAAMLIGWRLSDADGGGDPTQGWMQALFGLEWARWAALVFVAVIAGVGIAHIAKGVRAGFDKWLSADEDIMAALRPVCRIGLIARGLVFLVVAMLGFYAGSIESASDVPGTREALEAVQAMPFGWLLLLGVAAGLIAFAAYSFTEAVYRKVSL